MIIDSIGFYFILSNLYFATCLAVCVIVIMGAHAVPAIRVQASGFWCARNTCVQFTQYKLIICA